MSVKRTWFVSGNVLAYTAIMVTGRGATRKSKALDMVNLLQTGDARIGEGDTAIGFLNDTKKDAWLVPTG